MVLLDYLKVMIMNEKNTYSAESKEKPPKIQEKYPDVKAVTKDDSPQTTIYKNIGSPMQLGTGTQCPDGLPLTISKDDWKDPKFMAAVKAGTMIKFNG